MQFELTDSAKSKRQLRQIAQRAGVRTARADMMSARHYIAEGIDGYELGRCKADAKVYLHLGDLNRAISLTRTALFITRIRKQMA